MPGIARKLMELIRFSHTIFALPFALLAAALAWADERFRWQDGVGILLCMVFARSAAMAFNRVIDAKIDAKNPRTANREIPKGVISLKNARLFTIASSLFFMITAFFINQLCFFLSPVALLVVLGYSYTK